MKLEYKANKKQMLEYLSDNENIFFNIEDINNLSRVIFSDIIN
jgi:hypothetical protein